MALIIPTDNAGDIEFKREGGSLLAVMGSTFTDTVTGKRLILGENSGHFGYDFISQEYIDSLPSARSGDLTEARRLAKRIDADSLL